MRDIIRALIVIAALGLMLVVLFLASLIVSDVMRDKDERPSRPRVRASGDVPAGIVIDIQPDGGGLEGELDRDKLQRLLSAPPPARPRSICRRSVSDYVVRYGDQVVRRKLWETDADCGGGK